VLPLGFHEFLSAIIACDRPPNHLTYEPFLQAFDPQLRKAWPCGTRRRKLSATWSSAWIVRCDPISALFDGLADPNVFVLDPCCGIGAFVVEVLRRIERVRCASVVRTR
jgi:hypothetical protein